MVRLVRGCLAWLRIGLPQVIRSRERMRHDGGDTLKSQDYHAGLRVLPLKAMECGIYGCRQIMERIDDVVFCLNERCFSFMKAFVSQRLTSRKEEGFVQGGRICAAPLTL